MERKPTILLAEDHPVNREVAEHILHRLGYDVDVAVDGREVLAAVRKKDYPLILMDLRMPEIDGFEATRRIHLEIPPERRPVIAAMTADVTHQNRERCRDLGMIAFITKPIEKKQLAKILENYVDAGRGRAAEISGDGAATGMPFPPDLQ
ncbi:MAG: response regulator [Rhodothermales bacterium]